MSNVPPQTESLVVPPQKNNSNLDEELIVPPGELQTRLWYGHLRVLWSPADPMVTGGSHGHLLILWDVLWGSEPCRQATALGWFMGWIMGWIMGCLVDWVLCWVGWIQQPVIQWAG